METVVYFTFEGRFDVTEGTLVKQGDAEGVVVQATSNDRNDTIIRVWQKKGALEANKVIIFGLSEIHMNSKLVEFHHLVKDEKNLHVCLFQALQPKANILNLVSLGTDDYMCKPKLPKINGINANIRGLRLKMDRVLEGDNYVTTPLVFNEACAHPSNVSLTSAIAQVSRHVQTLAAYTNNSRKRYAPPLGETDLKLSPFEPFCIKDSHTQTYVSDDEAYENAASLQRKKAEDLWVDGFVVHLDHSKTTPAYWKTKHEPIDGHATVMFESIAGIPQVVAADGVGVHGVLRWIWSHVGFITWNAENGLAPTCMYHATPIPERERFDEKGQRRPVVHAHSHVCPSTTRGPILVKPMLCMACIGRELNDTGKLVVMRNTTTNKESSTFMECISL